MQSTPTATLEERDTPGDAHEWSPSSELLSTVFNAGPWLTLAWTDIRLRYRRTVLGPFWIVASTGALILATGFLYAGIFQNDPQTYIPFLGLGIITWLLIQGNVTEGCSIFIASEGMIQSLPTAPALYMLRLLARNLIIFAHNIVIIAILWLIFPWPIGLESLLFLPGLVICVVASFGLILTLGTLSTRFRDVPLAVASVLQIMFLATPIIWTPDSLRAEQLHFVINFNPLHYLVAVVRDPLLQRPLDVNDWLVAIAIAVGSAMIGALVYVRFRRRIPYWL